MMPVRFLTIPDRITLALAAGPLRPGEIRAAMLARDPGAAAPSVESIRATLSRSGAFRRVRRGLWARVG